MQLKIGNYWVYEWYRLDSLGNEIPTIQYHANIYLSDTATHRKRKHCKFCTVSVHIQKVQGHYKATVYNALELNCFDKMHFLWNYYFLITCNGKS